MTKGGFYSGNGGRRGGRGRGVRVDGGGRRQGGSKPTRVLGATSNVLTGAASISLFRKGPLAFGVLTSPKRNATLLTCRTALVVTVKHIAHLLVLISLSLSRLRSTCPEEAEAVDEAVAVEGSVEKEDSGRTICRPWASRSQISRHCPVRRAHYIPYVVFHHA